MCWGAGRRLGLENFPFLFFSVRSLVVSIPPPPGNPLLRPRKGGRGKKRIWASPEKEKKGGRSPPRSTFESPALAPVPSPPPPRLLSPGRKKQSWGNRGGPPSFPPPLPLPPRQCVACSAYRDFTQFSSPPYLPGGGRHDDNIGLLSPSPFPLLTASCDTVCPLPPTPLYFSGREA